MENSINVKMPSSCNSSQSSLPSLVLPERKYSSTETELSDEDVNKCPFSERGAKLTVSEFSTSASSSSSACKRRKRRKRRAASESKLLVTNHPSLSQRTHSCSISCSTERKISWRNTPCYYSQQICQVPCLTAPKDLRHAIGRHRGISGSSFPAIDATLFAMFYVTDAFDCVLSDASFQLLQSFRKSSALSFHNDINADDDEIRKSLLNTLKKEIVYSLRISYFCPASKIVKLGQLLEENYPLDLYQDAASFLDLLFGKILDRPHSLTYSNGSVDHIYRVHLESHLKRFYHHPSPLTVQRLLQRNFSNSAGLMAFNDSGQRIALSNDSLMGSIGGGLNVNVNTITKLLTSVPYPALLIQVVRKSTENENEGDDDNDNEDTTICRRPLIPNLEIDLTNFISYNSKSINKRGSYNYNGSSSMRKESGAGADSYMTQNSNMSLSLSGEYNEGYGVGVAAESRFRKGLKSAWKVMIQYMEDLTLTSHFALLENATLPINTRDRGSEYFCNNAHESGSPHFGGVRPTLEISNSLTTTTTSSTLSLPTRSTRARSELLNDSSTSSLTRSTSSSLQGQQQQKPPVRMELIGVICMSGNNCTSGTSSPSYSVYCKVGNGGKDATTSNDNGNSNGCKDEEGRYVPWVYYQTRPGVAPQVSLIENFEKWMESIEQNLLAENFRLHQIPVEIRRVLEDSHVLIYKRKE